MNTALTRIAAKWLHPHYPQRLQALAAAGEFCLSIPSMELALNWIFNLWTEENIAEAISQNHYDHHRYAAQILAGNTPAVIAQGFFQGAILNIPQCIKLPSQQSSFAKCLQQSFAELAPELAQLFEVNTWQNNLPAFYEKLRQADLVFAYGSDETMKALQQEISPSAVFVSHGHVESAAVIFKEAAHRESLEKLAYDMLSYDQRGCLSPRVTLIENGGALSPEDCAKIFAEEILPTVAKRLPRGCLFPGEAAEILHQRSVYGFRGTVYVGEDWTVCFSEKRIWPETAVPRFMPMMGFGSLEELVAILGQGRLISLGCAGRIEKLQRKVKVRYAPLGEMQKQLLVF